MDERSEAYEALRVTLARLAQAEIPQILAEARSLARVRARQVIEDALVEELLRAAGSRSATAAAPPEVPSAESVSGPGPHPESAECAWWAYCILAATERDAVPKGAPGVAPGSEVEAIQEGQLVALVSPVPLAEYSDDRLREQLNDIAWVERIARAHEQVLEQTLEHATILPLRLCTLYRDHEGVRRMLREQEPMLRETLSGLEGRREWGAKVFVDQDRLAEALAAAPGHQAPAQSSGAEYMARLGREREASERVHELGDAVVDEIHARLEAVADDSRANPLQRRELHGRPEQMLLNGAYLVSRTREQELRRLAEALRERWSASGFDLELTGPWPPYNFVSPSALLTP